MGINRRVLKAARHHGVPILSRRQWKSQHKAVYLWRTVNRRHYLLPKEPSDTLVQHITVTRDDGPKIRDFRADMREVEDIGHSRFGSGFSYNFGWDMQTGMIGVGQPLQAAGTHTINEKGVPGYSENQNYVAIAISAIGMPGDKPTEQAIDHLVRFIGVLIVQGVLTEHFDYVPHSLFAAKDCPTEPIRAIMPKVRIRAIRWARKHG